MKNIHQIIHLTNKRTRKYVKKTKQQKILSR
ncbi:unnamed protein product [Trichobilharzia regenti]|nr:unnamed protein product [Trichobilharzia regenti]